MTPPLYYSENVIAGSPTLTLMNSLTGYTVLRPVVGVNGGIAGYGGENDGTWEYTFNFLDNDGGWAATTGWLLTGDAVYTPSTGWEDITASPSIGDGQHRRGASFNITFTSTTITYIRFTFDFTEGASDSPTDIAWGIFRESFTALETRQFNQVGSGSGQTITWSGSQAMTAIQGYFLAARDSGSTPVGGSVTILNCTVRGEGDNPFTSVGGTGNVFYSNTLGSSPTVISVGGGVENGGYDVDDFNLGAHIASAGAILRSTTTYTGSFGTVTGVTTATGGVIYNLIRVPQRILTGTSLNNSASALHVVWGSDDDVSGETLWRGTLNLSTRIMSNITPITIESGGSNYHVIGPNALECYGGDSRVMLALVQENGETQIDLALRNEAGVWSLVQTDVNYTYVTWATSRAAWLGGANGIGFTSDRGATLQDRTGDFTEVIADLPLNGVIPTNRRGAWVLTATT